MYAKLAHELLKPGRVLRLLCDVFQDCRVREHWRKPSALRITYDLKESLANACSTTYPHPRAAATHPSRAASGQSAQCDSSYARPSATKHLPHDRRLSCHPRARFRPADLTPPGTMPQASHTPPAATQSRAARDPILPR